MKRDVEIMGSDDSTELTKNIPFPKNKYTAINKAVTSVSKLIIL